MNLSITTHNSKHIAFTTIILILITIPLSSGFSAIELWPSHLHLCARERVQTLRLFASKLDGHSRVPSLKKENKDLGNDEFKAKSKQNSEYERE